MTSKLTQLLILALVAQLAFSSMFIVIPFELREWMDTHPNGNSPNHPDLKITKFPGQPSETTLGVVKSWAA
jgi:hypothetical protein